MMSSLKKGTQLGLSTFAGLLLATTAAEPRAWTQSKWELNVEELPIQNCAQSSSAVICNELNEKNTTINTNHQALKTWAEEEIVQIGEWMRSKRYPQAKTWGDDYSGAVPIGRMELVENEKVVEAAILAAKRAGRVLSEEKLEEIRDTLASYFETPNMIALSKEAFLDGVDESDNSATLAHELFHAVHAGSRSNSFDDPEWVSEGLATAVEYEWLGGEANTKSREPKYNTPLPEPDDAYERGHFFFEMGEFFGDDMAFAGDIVQKPAAGDGVAWLDDYLGSRGTTLATYFPKFIAEKTDSSYFLPVVQPQQHLEIAVGSSGNYTRNSTVQPVAARYNELNVTFTGAGSAEEKDRVYLLDVNVPKAERLDDLSLIVGDRLTKASERQLSFVLAGDGSLQSDIEVKVVNIANQADESTFQTFDLALEASPVGFELPTCVEAGETAEIIMHGNLSKGEFGQISGIDLSASAGRLGNNLVFAAPSTPQTVNIYLTVPTMSGGTSKVELGKVEVGDNEIGGLNRSDSPIVGAYSLDIGATTMHVQGIVQVLAKPFTIPTGEIKYIDGGLVLEATYQGKFVSFDLDGGPCATEFRGTGHFATGMADINLSVTRDSEGRRILSGAMIHRSERGSVTWDIVLNRRK